MEVDRDEEKGIKYERTTESCDNVIRGLYETVIVDDRRSSKAYGMTISRTIVRLNKYSGRMDCGE